MKIQRFNESLDDLFSYPELKKSKKLSKKIKDFIINFSEYSDDNLIECISHISTNTKLTKLTEYDNLINPIKLRELAISKNIESIKEYADLDEESLELIEEYNNIEKKVKILLDKKNQLLTEVSNDLFYAFQEDLILKDFDGFYNIFMKDFIDDLNLDDIFYEIHPDIMKKYGKVIKKTLKDNYPDYNKLILMNATNKYNL